MNEITIGGGETSTGGETRGRDREVLGYLFRVHRAFRPFPSIAVFHHPSRHFRTRVSLLAAKEKSRERERETTRVSCGRDALASLRFRDTLRNRYCTPYRIYKYFYTFASRTLTVALAVRRGLRNCVDYSLTWIERNARNWSPRFIDSNGVSIDRSCFESN